MNRLSGYALSQAEKLGAGETEVYVSHTRELSIEVRNREVETLKEASSSGMGIRVFRQGRMGFAYTSVLTETGVLEAARAAVAASDYTGQDDFGGLPDPDSMPYPEVEYDPEIAGTSADQKIGQTLAMEEAARSRDPRIRVIESCGYEDVLGESHIVSSRGVEVSSQAAYCGIYTALLAEEEGRQETGFAMNFKRRYGDLDFSSVGIRAADKALGMLGAGSTATRKIPLILDPHSACSLLGVLSSSFSGENVLKGKSLLAGRVGEEVMSPAVTIVDDGALPGGVVSARADAEGLPTRRNVLVDAGRVRGFLHNTYTARRSGTVSTGSAQRSGYSGIPGVGITNFFLEPGKRSEKDLIASVPDGLYVTDLMGVHTANPVTGDFSLGASGLLIVNGQLAGPVRGVMVSGNLLNLFGQIREVADNLEFFAGTGSASVLTGPVTVSGD